MTSVAERNYRASSLDVSPVSLAVAALATSLVCLRLPMLVGGSFAQFSFTTLAVSYLSLVPLGLAAYVTIRSSTATINLRRAIPPVVAGTVVIISILRAGDVQDVFTNESGQAEALRLALFVLFACVIFVAPATHGVRSRCVRAALLAPAIYVLTNVILEATGITNPVHQRFPHSRGMLLEMVGIESDRVVFPMATGLNNFGVLAGAALAAVVVLIVRAERRWNRALLWLLAGASLAGLLLVDTRSAIVAAGAGALAALVKPRASAFVLPGFILLSAVLIAFVLPMVPLAGHLERQSVSGLSSTDQRELVLENVIEQLRTPQGELVWGHGAFGQQKSGISDTYAHLFEGPDRYAKSSHNFTLQMVLDVGLVGLLLLVILWARAAHAFARHATRDGTAAAALAALICLALVGSVEAAPSFYAPESFAFFVMLLAAAPVRSDVSADQAEPAREAERGDLQQRRP